MKSKLRPIASVSGSAAAIQAAAALLPYPWNVVAHILGVIGITIAYVAQSPLPGKAKPPLEEAVTAKRKGPKFPTLPPLPVLLLLVLGGCGGAVDGSATEDARAVTLAAFDCVDAASDAPSVHDGLLGCAPPALRVVSTLCAAGVIPPGAFCDEVGTLVQ